MGPHNKSNKSKQKSGFHHGDLQKAAAEAAYELVNIGGVQALSVRSVASACGVDHRALYRHYKDKQALIASVILKGFEELNLYLTEKTDIQTFDLLKHYTEFAFQNPHLYDLMFSGDGRRLFNDPEIARQIKALTIHAAYVAAQGVEQEGASLRDRVIRGWALAHGLIDLYRRGALKAATPEQAFEYIVKQLEVSAEVL